MKMLHLLLNRRRKSGKTEFAVSANMAYTQVNLGAIKAAKGEGEYEDPDKLARHGRGRGRFAPVQDSPSPYELPVSTEISATAVSNAPAGPAYAYATADEVGRSWKDTKIVDTAAEASQ